MDEDFNSSAAASDKKLSKKAKRKPRRYRRLTNERRRANERERKRAKELRDAFSQLRDIVPRERGEKAIPSRLEVLVRATVYIDRLAREAGQIGSQLSPKVASNALASEHTRSQRALARLRLSEVSQIREESGGQIFEKKKTRKTRKDANGEATRRRSFQRNGRAGFGSASSEYHYQFFASLFLLICLLFACMRSSKEHDQSRQMAM